MNLRPVNDGTEEVPIVYANAITMTAGPFDCSLHYAVGGGTGEEEPTELVRVIVSPQNAKLLAAMLKQYIDDYEKNFGNIPLPPEMQAKIDEDSD